jgi:hypothetical protein
MRLKSILFVVVLGVSGAGCQQHLVYVHDANLGIAVGASPNTGNVRMSLGYDRQTFAYVPRRGDGAAADDAMSVTAVSRVSAKGLGEVKFGHVIATGTPAGKIADDTGKLKETVKKVFGDQ